MSINPGDPARLAILQAKVAEALNASPLFHGALALPEDETEVGRWAVLINVEADMEGEKLLVVLYDEP